MLVIGIIRYFGFAARPLAMDFPALSAGGVEVPVRLDLPRKEEQDGAYRQNLGSKKDPRL